MTLVAVAKHATESPSLLPRWNRRSFMQLSSIIGLGVWHNISISGRPGRELQGGVHRLTGESIFLGDIDLWGSLHAFPVTL
jgi:hypothetical protein